MDKTSRDNIVKIIEYVAIGAVLILVLINVGKVIKSLLNNPISSGIGKVLGSLAPDFTFLGCACKSQPDCSKILQKDQCASACKLCLWDSKKLACNSTSDRKVGSGGFRSTGCIFLSILGGGIVIGILATVISRVVGFFRNKSSKAVEDVSQLSGESTDKVKSDIVEVVEILVEEIKEKYKEDNEGKEFSDSTIDYIASEITNRMLGSKAAEILNNNPGTDQNLASEIKQNYKTQQTENDNYAKAKESVDQKAADDAMDNIPEPEFPE